MPTMQGVRGTLGPQRTRPSCIVHFCSSGVGNEFKGRQEMILSPPFSSFLLLPSFLLLFHFEHVHTVVYLKTHLLLLD